MDAQGINKLSGIILLRKMTGEGDLLLRTFLKGRGLLYIIAKGAATGKVRFGGSTEPFVCGIFTLYRGKGGGLYLKSLDVADDMIKLRGRYEALMTAVRWVKLLTRMIMPEQPDDFLLANLYWNLKFLDEAAVPAAVADWRFVWRWLKHWGLAPDLSFCSVCGRELQNAFLTGRGLCCSNCADTEVGLPLSAAELSILKHIATADPCTLVSFCRERSSSLNLRFLSNVTGRMEEFFKEI